MFSISVHPLFQGCYQPSMLVPCHAITRAYRNGFWCRCRCLHWHFRRSYLLVNASNQQNSEYQILIYCITYVFGSHPEQQYQSWRGQSMLFSQWSSGWLRLSVRTVQHCLFIAGGPGHSKTPSFAGDKDVLPLDCRLYLHGQGWQAKKGEKSKKGHFRDLIIYPTLLEAQHILSAQKKRLRFRQLTSLVGLLKVNGPQEQTKDLRELEHNSICHGLMVQFIHQCAHVIRGLVPALRL